MGKPPVLCRKASSRHRQQVDTGLNWWTVRNPISAIHSAPVLGFSGENWVCASKKQHNGKPRGGWKRSFFNVKIKFLKIIDTPGDRQKVCSGPERIITFPYQHGIGEPFL